MKIIWSVKAATEYEDWKKNDKSIQKKINALIENIKQTPYAGIGKPEPLRFQLSGLWSRRINREHRLVYTINSNGDLEIVSCMYHY